MSCERSSIEEEVLEKIRPSRTQIIVLSRLYEVLKRRIEKCLEEVNVKAVVEVEGSYAKGTILSNKWEIDVFTIFSNVSEEWVKNNSLSILLKCIEPLPAIVKYAEHPYITVSMLGVEAEIVPTIEAESPSKIKLGVGRTPFHTSYVKRKIESNPCLADDIRLLKSFMEGIGVYGAEIGGFSGYLAELLTIHYGSFRNVLKASLTWKPQVYIDVEGVGDATILKAKYRDSPMIVVDPVDPSRNAAASVTQASLSAFIIASKIYLTRPMLELFHIAPRVYKVARLGPAIMAICSGNYSEIPKENILSMARRFSGLLASILKERGFKVTWRIIGSDYTSKVIIIVGLESLTLPDLEYRVGPTPWESLEGALNFIARRLNEGGIVWISEDGVLEGLRSRRFKSAVDTTNRVANKLAYIVKASRCEFRECIEGIVCLRESGLREESITGLPHLLWPSLIYSLQKHS